MPNILFNPPPGLHTDDTGLTADGKWASGNNVRFWQGKPQAIGGWAVRSLTGASLSGTCRNIYEWDSSAGVNYIAYGTSTKLFVEVSGVLYDITPAGFSATGTGQWSLQAYGDTLLASQNWGKLYQWSNNTAVVAAEIVNAPDKITAMLVTPERQVLALGCNEEISGTFNALCVRGSDLEDPTDWTTTATNNAFEHIIDDGGRVVAARLIGPYVGIWTQTNLYQGQFLGDPAQTYRFDKISTSAGCLGLDSVLVKDSTAYWITYDLEFYVWSPGDVARVLESPLTLIFRAGINATKANSGYTFGVYVARFSEVWFFYRGTSSGSTPNKYIAFSTLDGAWFMGALTRTAMSQTHESIIGVDDGFNILNHETGKTGAGTGGLSWSIEAGAYYLSSAQQKMMIRGVWPDFKEQDGNITLRIRTFDYPANAGDSHTYTLADGATKKNFRTSGRLVTFGFEGSDLTGTTSTFMRLGTPVFDVVPTGKR